MLHVVQWCCSGDTRPHLPHGQPGRVLPSLPPWPYPLAQAVHQPFPIPLRGEAGLSASHSQCPAVRSVVLVPPQCPPNPCPCGCHLPPLCTPDHPWAPQGKTRGVSLPSRAGKGMYLGKKLPGGSGSGRTGLPLGHCTSFLPMPTAACCSPATLPVCYCRGSA